MVRTRRTLSGLTGGGRCRQRVLRQAGLCELVADFVGSVRHLACLDRACRSSTASVSERFAAPFLYVFPMEQTNQKPPMFPMAGARLHLGTLRWERVTGADLEGEVGGEDQLDQLGSAFIPEMSALGRGRAGGGVRGDRLRFYTQCASYAPLDSHFEFCPEAGTWRTVPALSRHAPQQSSAGVVAEHGSSVSEAAALAIFEAENPDSTSLSAVRLSGFKSVGDDLYVVGGVEGNFAPSATVRRWRDGAWAEVAPMLSPRFAACCVATGAAPSASLVVLGGYVRSFGQNSQSLTAERYDVATDAWEALPSLHADGGEVREGDLLTADLNGTLYAVQAHYKRDDLARVQRLEPGASTWTLCARLPVPPTAIASDGDELFATNVLLSAPKANRLLAMSGKIDDDNAQVSSPVLIQAYDPDCDEWQPLYEILDPALGFTAVIHNNAVYCPLHAAARRDVDDRPESMTVIGRFDLDTKTFARLGPPTPLCDPRQGPAFVVARAPESARRLAPAAAA